MDNNSNDNENYTVEFIDPSELVGFEPDREFTAKAAAPAQESAKSSEQPSKDSNDKEEIDFEFTNILKEKPTDYVIKRREDTRGKLALVYTIATFGVFVIGMLIAVLDGLSRKVSIIDNLKEILPLLSGIFLGSLGFVIGYYFKKGDDRD